jgi:methylisocitrate lyase
MQGPTPRRRCRQLLDGDVPIFAPLCLDALTARIAAAYGFEAGYVSGGALGYAMAVSEALLTLTEVALVTQQVVRRSDLPIIVDAGVGFGDAVHGARTIWEIEATGVAAIKIEDQVAPKPVSHHRGTASNTSSRARR